VCDLDLLLDLDLHPARARQTHDQRLISRTEARSAYVQAMGVSKYQTASQDQLGNFELLTFPSLRLVAKVPFAAAPAACSWPTSNPTFDV
jgi:D-serine deaminase-like pyridoxal phosphate-dependent protein